jgi:hypothetical protein
MATSLFDSLFSSTSTTTDGLAAQSFLACLATALLIGLLLALVHARSSHSSRGFVTTLALLPAIVCAVILMVNGNLGAGVAVAGAFSLVRFRSAPGSAREICSIFLAMGAGLICGMGYLAYALLFSVIMGAVMVLYGRSNLGARTAGPVSLHITIPENLDYVGEFDDLFEQYTVDHELTSVKTTNKGSLFKLSYTMTMRDETQQKAFIDQLRCRNGNLEISIAQQQETDYEL